MMAKFLYWITGFLPCRFIDDGKTRYLERYYLFTAFGWRFYIHHFVASDPDRGLHDHPFAKAYSLILSGWYWEERRRKFGKDRLRKVRWFNSLTGDTFHRVVLPARGPLLIALDDNKALTCDRESIPCWTLFFHTAGDVKEWGFLRHMSDPYDVQIFTPYTYAREGKQADWWITAKTRAQLQGGKT